MNNGLEGAKLGRYQLLCRIAQGGMSEIYLGYDRRVRRRVAVKVLYGRDDLFVRRFEREALAIGTLSHDHILPLYDFGVQYPWYYLVMPFVEGGTLRDYLYKREWLTLEEAGSFLYQMTSALQHAHDHGVIHRDVKPSNILLRLDGHAYLVDFGLAKARMTTDALSHAGTMIGTPEYMAPERLDHINDPRSDLYSLGIILYQMLTGHLPFTGETPVAITLKHLQIPPIPPRQLNSEIPQSVEDIVLKALAKNPDDRYQYGSEFAADYRQALQQEWLMQAPTYELASLGQGYPAQTMNDFTINVSSTHDDYSYEMPDKYHLFPLDYDESPIPIIAALNRKQKWTRLFSFSLGLLLFSIVVALAVFWQMNNQRNARPQMLTPTFLHRDNTATAQANAQATIAAGSRVQATTGITPAIGAGKILYSDAMTKSGHDWVDDGKQCSFSPQGYRVSTSLSYTVAWCYNTLRSFANAAISVQAQLLHGDFYGLIFRLNPSTRAFYVLEINEFGQYRFQRALGRDPSKWLTLIDWKSSPALLSGYRQTNQLLVITLNGHFSFYINQQLTIPIFTDTTYANGLIGLLVGGDDGDGTVAIFKNIGVFQK